MHENEMPWGVGVVAQTVAGEITLRMTTAQAIELRECLAWLTDDDEEDDDDD